ncbi:uncharacterized protein LOC107043026 [Diachasma alloeum]|uniref:uncharacterized protein LOC107043026 n=1 Tax=Diachasma alloeum TaxID=454923 RepID=UPI000738141E|nr:uncharacterized protein LOC107043026 [Diachasma alloeum]
MKRMGDPMGPSIPSSVFSMPKDNQKPPGQNGWPYQDMNLQYQNTFLPQPQQQWFSDYSRSSFNLQGYPTTAQYCTNGNQFNPNFEYQNHPNQQMLGRATNSNGSYFYHQQAQSFSPMQNVTLYTQTSIQSVAGSHENYVNQQLNPTASTPTPSSLVIAPDNQTQPKNSTPPTPVLLLSAFPASQYERQQPTPSAGTTTTLSLTLEREPSTPPVQTSAS